MHILHHPQQCRNCGRMTTRAYGAGNVPLCRVCRAPEIRERVRRFENRLPEPRWRMISLAIRALCYRQGRRTVELMMRSGHA